MDAQIAQAYPTPVGQFRFPDPGAVNAGLRRLILERERADAGAVYANVGGWHSHADLLTWPAPEVATLQNWIGSAVGKMLEATAGSAPPRGKLSLTAWANVSRAGNYHRIHNHPESCWSGVYYVEAGAEVPGQPLSGVLELCDPRPGAEMVNTPGSPFGQRAVIRPAAGLMVIFPGWLNHFVNPYQGAGERISVAFNVRWQPGPG